LLITGGSLGARSINEAVAESIKKFEEKGIQVIWQTGKDYFDQNKNLASDFIKVMPFIDKMNFAYSACNLLLARAGATTISELLALGIPSILVPSPNVAENHQYYNAKSLEKNNAAILLEDKRMKTELADEITGIIFNEDKLNQLRQNALSLAKPGAAGVIAKNAIKYAQAV
jgi:UDP-N-acetylglucosamine--N-acetylmuramyl-(pentapeptide) pyrophosphoryl-undecaprenol N-acetylglucosamine transferase